METTADASRPAPPRVEAGDVRVALLYVAIVTVLALTGLRNDPVLGAELLWPAAVSLPLLIVGAASTVLRRRAPVVVLAVAGPLSVIEILGGGQLGAYLLLFEALFEPVNHGSRRLARATTVLGTALSVLAFALAWIIGGFGPHLWGVLLLATLLVMTPLLWAWEVRHHRQARRDAEALAAAEQALARSRAQQEVEAERRRIAHDLHDVIAGHLGAVSLHTGLAATLPTSEARDRSLATAGESSRAALRDLRAMITVLAEDAEAAPEVTVDWEALADRLRGGDPAAGIELDPAAADPERVDPAVRAALLRIATEAVANALRHGRAPMSLRLHRKGEEVVLTLRNARDGGPVGTGLGRDSLSARARAVGGTARSGPSDVPDGTDGTDGTGGWLVEARLPARPAAPAPSPSAPPSPSTSPSPPTSPSSPTPQETP